MQTHCERLASYCPFVIENVQDTRHGTNLHIFSEALKAYGTISNYWFVKSHDKSLSHWHRFSLSNVIGFYFKI